MHLRGKTCRLRPWQMQDAPAIAEHANNRKIWRNLGDAFPHPYTLGMAESWLTSILGAEDPARTFAICINDGCDGDGKAVGSAGITIADDACTKTAKNGIIGYWLGEPFWGRAIATEAVSLLVAYAFATFPFHRLEANVKAWNPASGRVLEKNGFRLEGRLRERIFKDGEFTDQLVYGLLRKDYEAATHLQRDANSW